MKTVGLRRVSGGRKQKDGNMQYPEHSVIRLEEVFSDILYVYSNQDHMVAVPWHTTTIYGLI